MNKPKTTLKRPFPRVTTPVGKDSLTKQSFAHETNINNIVGKYLQTGEMPRINPTEKTYGYAPSYDFREAMEIVQNMNSNFDQLPSKIRAKFGHNPAKFLEFVENPSNAAECAAMGLFGDNPNEDTPRPSKAEKSASTPVSGETALPSEAPAPADNLKVAILQPLQALFLQTS